MIEIAHKPHQGITKTKQHVRASMWFPKMDSMIEERLNACQLCQAVTDTHQREPIHPTEMPSAPWSSLCTDIFGPLPTGEYLVLVQDLYSRFPEVAITYSTSSAAVIPAIDKILAAFGTPEVLGSDNGPPFNSHKFTRFAKKLGFRHQKITPLAPWANGTAERFMKNLAKVVQISHADHKNWRHELIKYLRAYRATPHSMTGVTPAALMFNGRKYGTNLPSIQPNASRSELQAQAEQADQRSKAKMKRDADGRGTVRLLSLKPGDQVLLKQKKLNKLTTAYETTPYTVVEVKGSQVTAENEIHQVTRHVNLFKKLPPIAADLDLAVDECPPIIPPEPATEASEPAGEPSAPPDNQMSTTDASQDTGLQPQQASTETSPSRAEVLLPPRRSGRNKAEPVRYPAPDRQPAP